MIGEAGAWKLIQMIFAPTAMLLLHYPIYRAYRWNKQNRKPPRIWEAALLSFFPSPVGGILYVGGVVPALIAFAPIVLVYVLVRVVRDLTGASAYPVSDRFSMIIYFAPALVLGLISGVWGYKIKKQLGTEDKTS